METCGKRFSWRRRAAPSACLFVLVCILGLLVLDWGGRLIIATNAEKPLVVSPIPDMDKLCRRDTARAWQMKPNQHWDAFDSNQAETSEVSTNELGLRGESIGPKGNRFRILAIGDSTTFGLGVNDSETWPARLQEVLDPDASEIEVLNAGVPGYTAYQGLLFLTDVGLALAPDLVLATFGFNDQFDSPFEDEQLIDSLSYGGVVELAVTLRRKLLHEPAPRRKRLSPAVFLETILKMKELCDSHDVDLVYVLWPTTVYLEQREKGRVEYIDLCEWAARYTETPFVELRPRFTKEWERVYFPNDYVHATEYGCRVAADAIAETVKPRVRAMQQ